MTTGSSPGDLFRKFLHEPNIAERVRITSASIDGLSPDAALSVLFSALNIAVDQLRSVSEIAITMGLSSAEINEELTRKGEQRAADYQDYQFHLIVDELETGRPVPDINL